MCTLDNVQVVAKCGFDASADGGSQRDWVQVAQAMPACMLSVVKPSVSSRLPRTYAHVHFVCVCACWRDVRA